MALDVTRRGEGSPSGTIDPAGAACPAPFLVMDFDPEGNVHACCVGALHPLGNVGSQSIREIWEGERAQVLRRALARDDFDFGCGSCRHRVAEGSGPPDLEYYRTMPPSPDPAWPQVMAFALNNTCNLQCVMCGGNFSSKIRSQREQRPKLEPPYHDRFYDELAEFLPHLRRVEFRGGEPFLIRENQRVWDLIVEQDLDLEVQATTNGTVWNEEVERVLDALPFQITMSMDGVTAETNEAIRIGTDHAEVLENFERFARYAAEKGTRLDLSFCLLRHNWHEVADIIEHADRLGVDAHAQQVLEREHALHRLPTDELEQVLEAMQARGERLEVELDSNRWTWDNILGWLRTEIDQRRTREPLLVWEQPGPENSAHAARTRDRVLETSAPEASWWRRLGRRFARPGVDAELLDAWRRRLAGWSSSGATAELVTGPDGLVVHADLAAVAPPGRDDPPDVLGLSFAEALEALADRFGPYLALAYEFVEPDAVDQVLFLGHTPWRQKSGLVVRTASLPERRGGEATGAIHTVLATDTWFWPTAEVAQPVKLSRRPTAGAGVA